MQFKIISLDVWGHGPDACKQSGCDGNCDGYIVNDAHYTGRTVEVPDTGDDAAREATIVRALVDAGELNEKCLAPGTIEIDGEEDYTLYVNDARDGQPLLQLERDSYQCIDPECPDAATMPYHDHPNK